MTSPSWVTLHSIACSFIELHKPLLHDKTVIHEGETNDLLFKRTYWSLMGLAANTESLGYFHSRVGLVCTNYVIISLSYSFRWSNIRDNRTRTLTQLECLLREKVLYSKYTVTLPASCERNDAGMIQAKHNVQDLAFKRREYSSYSKEKIAQIRCELDSTVDMVPVQEVSRAPSGPSLMDEFQLLRPDDVDKVLGMGEDKGSASLLVLLDLSVAFDVIDYGILLDRLADLGVGGTVWQWFHSYLAGQFQMVVLGDYSSVPWQLCHGVPQGSILSSMLINIYMKLLGEVIRRFGLWSHQYADDTQLYLSFTSAPGEVVAVLNQCLAKVIGWMRANKLSLNPDKTEVLLVGSTGLQVGDFNPVLDRVALPLKDRVYNLGVLLAPELSLEFQVVAVAFLQLRLIHQLHPYLDEHSLATVIHALVTSHLDYCNMLCVRLPLNTVQILQLVLNRTARPLTETSHYSHVTPVLYQLHWLPVEVWAQFKVLVLTYKALNSLGPGYLKEHLLPYMPSRPLRSAGEALLRKPFLREISKKMKHFIKTCRLFDYNRNGQIQQHELRRILEVNCFRMTDCEYD
ncbi:putative RNA-directed DNA polymerase from transposon BS, partial [Varanus komodoensis]